MSTHIFLTFFISYLTLDKKLSTVGQNTCDGNFLDFANCLQGRLQTNGNTEDSKLRILDKNVQEKISHCFTDSHCDEPNFEYDSCNDLSQPIRTFINNVRQELGKAPGKVEECLKAKFAHFADECASIVLNVSRRLIANSSYTQIKTSTQDFGTINGFFMGNGGNNQSDENSTDRKRAGIILVNIAAAIRRCKEKNAGDDNKVKPVLQCLLDTISADTKRTMCQAASSCDGNGASVDCKKQHRQDLHNLCVCRRGKQKEALKKLDDLRKSESVPVLDVVSALGNGRKPEETCNEIRECYIRNGVPPPPSMNLLDMFIIMQQMKQPRDKPGGSPMRVDNQTLTIIRDLFDAGDFGDEECKTCDI